MQNPRNVAVALSLVVTAFVLLFFTASVIEAIRAHKAPTPKPKGVR